MSKATLATITNKQDNNTLLEVTLDQSPEGKPLVQLRRLSWGAGVGWYPQQPFLLSPEEAEALLLSLRTTRQLWQEQRHSKSGKVIPFPALPTLTTQQKSRKPRLTQKK